MKARLTAASIAALGLAACESVAPPAATAPVPVATAAAPATPSIAALYLRPAERALVDGIRLYEEASFDRAESALQTALREGLADGRDRAAAYKYLAFIACAFGRIAECAADFENAFAGDPNFSLNEKEIGHPVWGPVYRRVAAAQRKP